MVFRFFILAAVFVAVAVFFFVLPARVIALEPDEILVVANKNAARSVGLARYYMDKRGVPEDNLLQLWVTDREHCSREDYNRKIAAPVDEFLDNYRGGPRIRCLLLIYGVPLKVGGPPLTREEKEDMAGLEARREELERKLAETADSPEEALQKELAGTRKEIKREKRRRNRSASVDSELALVRAGGHPLSLWVRNPYFLGFQGRDLDLERGDVLMVARLDGPDSDTVKRLINDSLESEKKGLMGTAYFDARWPEPGRKKESGYAFYDQSIHQAAGRVKEKGGLKVVVEDSGELFQPGDCPEAALYCGWYRLARYVDAFDWVQGSVGYHIASQECQTLRRGNSRVWCKRMLEEGVAATLGPVGEPYVQSFPVPGIFFTYLLDGDFSLAECYLLANPFWSWKMVLVGDPLYRPFAAGK
ncbi:MAG: TIGR03790 family protein [Thermodesulfobacteriota bacterium]